MTNCNRQYENTRRNKTKRKYQDTGYSMNAGKWLCWKLCKSTRNTGYLVKRLWDSHLEAASASKGEPMRRKKMAAIATATFPILGENKRFSVQNMGHKAQSIRGRPSTYKTRKDIVGTENGQ